MTKINTPQAVVQRARTNQASAIERAVMGGFRLLRTGLAGPYAPSSLDRR